METERHKKQMELLINSLQPWLDQHQGGYVNGNMFVYYSARHVRNQDFKGPDVFVVLKVSNGERKSWVLWEEGKGPDVVIELLSDSTSAVDKQQKKQIYQTQLQVAEYFWFDPFNPNDWKGFYLTSGVYEEQKPQHGCLLSRALGLNLIHWRGVHKNIDTVWLRWATLAGELLLLPEETAAQRAEAEAQRAEAEAQRAAVAEQRVLIEVEARRAEAQRADLAEQRAKAAEAELAHLKRLLANRP
jgi:Uma2 family endonuclease